jgi:hypothetical protein
MYELMSQNLLFLWCQPGDILKPFGRLSEYSAQLKGPDIGLIAHLVHHRKSATLFAELRVTVSSKGIRELSVKIASRALGCCAEGPLGHELLAGRFVDILVLLDHTAALLEHDERPGWDSREQY